MIDQEKSSEKRRKGRERENRTRRSGDEGSRRLEMGGGSSDRVCGFKKKWGHVFSVKLLGP